MRIYLSHKNKKMKKKTKTRGKIRCRQSLRVYLSLQFFWGGEFICILDILPV